MGRIGSFKIIQLKDWERGVRLPGSRFFLRKEDAYTDLISLGLSGYRVNYTGR